MNGAYANVKASRMNVDLPDGHKAELREVTSLTGADQDKYQDAVDAALEGRRREAEALVIASNPAAMPDPSAPGRGRG